MSLFDAIVDAGEIEDACIAHLKEWEATYLDEVAQQRGRPRGTYQKPRTHTTVNDFDKWPEEKLPCLLLIAPGTVEQPRRRGDGRYTGDWYIAVAIVVSARSQKSTKTLAKRYGAAYRALLLQRADFDGRLNGKMAVKEWVSEDYDDLDDDSDTTRNLAVAKLIFTVEVTGVVNAFAGPSEDDPRPPDEEGDPTPDYGELTTADKLTVGVIENSLDTTLVPDVVTTDPEEA